MLRELGVRGLGVLGDVSVSFASGLNVLTGETGAGKTLLVTSLALLLGSRSDSRLVAGDDARVEAEFAAPDGVRALLRERELDDTEDLVIARRITSDGRSRAWLQGTAVPAGALAEVGASLVEIHGQQEAFALARPQVQLDALDAFAGSLTTRGEFRATLVEVRGLRAELERTEASERERARTLDTLRHQAEEIERARLDADADETLETDVARLEHAERLSEIAESARQLAGGDGAASSLGEAAKLLGEAGRIDPAYLALAERASALEAEAAELASDVRAASQSLDDDPAHLEHLRSRLALVGRLKRRYGDTVQDVMAFAARVRSEMDDLEHAGERAAEISSEIAALEPHLDELAAKLRGLRSSGAGRLAASVRSELPALALPQASFEIRITDGAETEQGRDAVEFLFSANPGAAPGPIGKVASGGELSRAMIAVSLALASQNADANGPSILVFDEADQGVGGQAALELAARLAALGRTHQVLVVTHLAQIAAFADHHLAVHKTADGVDVRVVEGAERVTEISRMLSGLGSSERAQAHAAELIELAAGSAKRKRRVATGKVGVA